MTYFNTFERSNFIQPEYNILFSIRMKRKIRVIIALTLFYGFAASAQQQPEYHITGKKVKIFVTEKNTGKRISDEGTLQFSPHAQPVETEVTIFVDPSKTFQTMLGIGGALTDAVAETFYKLPKDKQQELLTAYYDKDKGIGYTLARTSIQSSDFSSASYGYVQDNDRSLKSFDCTAVSLSRNLIRFGPIFMGSLSMPMRKRASRFGAYRYKMNRWLPKAGNLVYIPQKMSAIL